MTTTHSPADTQRRLAMTVVRVSGVPVIFHASHLVPMALTGLVFFALSARGPSPALVTAASLAGVMASVLAHELAHGLTARRFGQQVVEYGFSLSGAYTRPAGHYPSLRAAGCTLAAGPAVSLMLAVSLMAATVAVRYWELSAALDQVLLLTAAMNLLLGAGNLLPARPLDGGRLLEVLLLSQLRDAGATSRAAAWVSSALAVGVVAGGIWLMQDGAISALLIALGVVLLVMNVGGQLVGAGLSVKVAGYNAPDAPEQEATTR